MNDPVLRARSMLQFAVVIAVIGIVALFLLDALYDALEEAERTVVEATVRNMDSGLRVEVAHRVIRGEEASIGELAGANPVQWLQNPPDGYAGPCHGEPVPGGWCFDAATHEIVYRPRVARHLELRRSGRPGLRWRVTSAAEIADRRGGTPASAGALRVFPTVSFVWH